MRGVFYGAVGFSILITIVGINTYPTIPDWADNEYIFKIPRALYDYEELRQHVSEKVALWFAFYTATLTCLALSVIGLSCILIVGVRFDGNAKKDDKIFHIKNPYLRDLLTLLVPAMCFCFLLFLSIPFETKGLQLSLPISPYSLFWYVLSDPAWIMAIVETTIATCRLYFPERTLIK